VRQANEPGQLSNLEINQQPHDDWRNDMRLQAQTDVRERGSANAAAVHKRPRALVLFAAVGLLAVPGLAPAGDVTPFTVALPTATGPIPSSATSFPFGAEGFDVLPPVPKGYVEEEFFFSGKGNIYEFTPTGVQIVSPCPAALTQGCTNIPYTTRMLVKRPKNRHRFSGTVIIEPLNPSAGWDIAAVWDRSRDSFVRDGDIFVGWSSKSVIVNTLKNWDPDRYAALNWTYQPPTPGSNNGAYDGITFDIAAQIGRLIKENGPNSPIHGYHVKRVFEAGFSQDGGFTFTQADIFHALERMPGGGPVYDGYVPMGTNGPSNINFGLTPAGALSLTDPRRQMQPRDVPVIHANTETEVYIGTLVPGGLLYRQPDSNAPNNRLRIWEVPGGSHVSNDANDPALILQLDQAELDRIPVSEIQPIGCAHQQFVDGPAIGIEGVISPNNYPFSFAQNAAFRALRLWVDFNIPPPHVAPIDVDTSTIPAHIVRDQFGNATGGLRTPFLDVPITTYTPFDTVAHTTAFSGFCILYGYNEPFDHDQLASLYKNHGQYVVKVAHQSLGLVKDRLWLLPDAIDAIQRAVRADVP
jgi:Alpha/beta hydrolase domain